MTPTQEYRTRKVTDREREIRASKELQLEYAESLNKVMARLRRDALDHWSCT